MVEGRKGNQDGLGTDPIVGKKSYRPPQLFEYGTLREITQTNFASGMKDFLIGILMTPGN